MKFLRVICNILLFIAIFLGTSVVQIAVYDIYAIQSEDVDGIHVISPNSDDVSVVDSVGFWITDIANGLKQAPKHRVRNWMEVDWWKIGGGFVDKGIDVVGGVVKPVALPISEVNAIKNYHDMTMDDFTAHLAKYEYASDQELNNALYELYVLFDKGYGETVKTVGENPVDIHEWTEYDGRYKDSKIELNDFEFDRWISRNTKLYNHLYKLIKYNDASYDIYYEKFIVASPDGSYRYIKSAAVVLYYQFLVSIAVAAFFVWKYPITLVQYNINGNSGNPNRRRDNGQSDIDLLD